jgi:hypothetical protein
MFSIYQEQDIKAYQTAEDIVLMAQLHMTYFFAIAVLNPLQN